MLRRTNPRPKTTWTDRAQPGERYLVGSGTGGSRRGGYVVRWLSLGHRDPRRHLGGPRRHLGGPWLIVETAPGRSAPSASVRRRRLAERLWSVERLQAYRTGGQLPQDWPRFAERPDPAWSATHIEIDGTPVGCEYLAVGEGWAAWSLHGEHAVSLLASRMPVESVALTTVIDIEQYIDGSRRPRATAVCAVPQPQPSG